jgi:hypothetical protein
MYSLFTFTSLLVTVAFFVQGTTGQESLYPSGKSFKPGYCNICRDVPDQDYNNPSQFRVLANPSESFQMSGKAWSCGYLQDTVQDVNPYSGAAGEARWCGLAQTFAEQSCTCSGPSIPSMNANVKDLNPACDLCKGQDLDYVPQVNAGITANTGVAGNMNCKGLYNAMSEGVLTSNLCPAVIANAGATCCSINIEEISVSGGGGGGSTSSNNNLNVQKPVCASGAGACVTNGDCCSGLKCTVKVFNMPKSCSSIRTRTRASIAGNGIGGAAARSRTGN